MHPRMLRLPGTGPFGAPVFWVHANPPGLSSRRSASGIAAVRVAVRVRGLRSGRGLYGRRVQVRAVRARPPLRLSTLGHSRELRQEWHELDVAIGGNCLHRGTEFLGVDLVDPREGVDISEITPAGVHLTAVDRGHDLLSEHHRQRVAEHRDRGLIERHDARQFDELRRRPDGISPTARQVAVLARATEERRRELDTQQRRAEAAERHSATVVHRAEEAVARWIEHASWPATTAAPPVPGTLRALRLTGSDEAVGSFHSDKLDREVLYESSLELAALTVLENSADIAWYQEQPLKIPYTCEGRQRVYYPDLLAATHTGRCLLIEVKPLMNMPVALNRAKAAAGRAYAHKHGWGWVAVDGTHTERDLETHVIPAASLRAITAGLEAHGHLGWRQILDLRANSRVTPRDIAAFVTQTSSQLVLEPHYRITAAP